MHSLLKIALAATALLAAAPAVAQQADKSAQPSGPIGKTAPNSSPGVQGMPGTRTGPAIKAPGDQAAGGPVDASPTQPSQDARNVQGFADTRTGPATRTPGDTAGESTHRKGTVETTGSISQGSVDPDDVTTMRYVTEDGEPVAVNKVDESGNAVR